MQIHQNAEFDMYLFLNIFCKVGRYNTGAPEQVSFRGPGAPYRCSLPVLKVATGVVSPQKAERLLKFPPSHQIKGGIITIYIAPFFHIYGLLYVFYNIIYK